MTPRSLISLIRASYLLLVLGILTPARPVFAEDIRATARVDSNHILIGDWLRLTFEVQHSAGVTAGLPFFPDSLEGFVVVHRDSPAVTQSEGNVLQTLALTITAFDSGMHIIPAFSIPYMVGGDTAKRFTSTSPIPIVVHGIQVDTSKEIKDIKPPLSVPITLADLLPYLIAIVVIAGLVWLVLYIRKKRQRGERLLPEAPPRPAHEVALEELRALESEHLWQRGKVKEYHSQLTDIIRTYIERRFATMAMEMTTDEILHTNAIAALDAETVAMLKEILVRADLVKFAKFMPAPQEHETSYAHAVAFVHATVPARVEPRDEAAPAEIKA